MMVRSTGSPTKVAESQPQAAYLAYSAKYIDSSINLH